MWHGKYIFGPGFGNSMDGIPLTLRLSFVSCSKKLASTLSSCQDTLRHEIGHFISKTPHPLQQSHETIPSGEALNGGGLDE